MGDPAGVARALSPFACTRGVVAEPTGVARVSPAGVGAGAGVGVGVVVVVVVVLLLLMLLLMALVMWDGLVVGGIV